MKFRTYDQHQMMLLPNSLEDLIPRNHLVRAIDLVVDQLDLRGLYNRDKKFKQAGREIRKRCVLYVFYGCHGRTVIMFVTIPRET